MMTCYDGLDIGNVRTAQLMHDTIADNSVLQLRVR